MNHIWKFSIIAVLLAVMLSGYLIIPMSESPKAYELAIMKIGNDWKVVDAADHNKTKVKAKKKDTIVWTVIGTDASLQFPAELFDPVSVEDTLTNGYTKYLQDGKKLKLKVKNSAEAGTYEYAVFCISEGVFATGDSPPKLIIE